MHGHPLGRGDRRLGQQRRVAEAIEVAGAIEVGVGALEVLAPVRVGVVDVAFAQERRHRAHGQQRQPDEQPRPPSSSSGRASSTSSPGALAAPSKHDHGRRHRRIGPEPVDRRMRPASRCRWQAPPRRVAAADGSSLRARRIARRRRRPRAEQQQAGDAQLGQRPRARRCGRRGLSGRRPRACADRCTGIRRRRRPAAGPRRIVERHAPEVIAVRPGGEAEPCSPRRRVRLRPRGPHRRAARSSRPGRRRRRRSRSCRPRRDRHRQRDRRGCSPRRRRAEVGQARPRTRAAPTPTATAARAPSRAAPPARIASTASRSPSSLTVVYRSVSAGTVPIAGNAASTSQLSARRRNGDSEQVDDQASASAGIEPRLWHSRISDVEGRRAQCQPRAGASPARWCRRARARERRRSQRTRRWRCDSRAGSRACRRSRAVAAALSLVIRATTVTTPATAAAAQRHQRELHARAEQPADHRPSPKTRRRGGFAGRRRQRCRAPGSRAPRAATRGRARERGKGDRRGASRPKARVATAPRRRPARRRRRARPSPGQQDDAEVGPLLPGPPRPPSREDRDQDERRGLERSASRNGCRRRFGVVIRARYWTDAARAPASELAGAGIRSGEAKPWPR